MAVLRNQKPSNITAEDRTATAADLAFARRSPEDGAWRRTLKLAKRAYGPLLVYVALGIFLIIAIAIRLSIWAPAI